MLPLSPSCSPAPSSGPASPSSPVSLATPRLTKFSRSLRQKIGGLEECNSELSFLSETSQQSTPHHRPPNQVPTKATPDRANSVGRGREGGKQDLLSANSGSKPNGELFSSSDWTETARVMMGVGATEAGTAQIVTIRNAQYETLPIGLSQDIPDVFL